MQQEDQGRFDSGWLADARWDGRRVQFPRCRLWEQNGPVGPTVKAWAESHAGAHGGVMNKHGTHRATCLCCRHLALDRGTDGYDSDPGSQGEITCEKGVFDFGALEYDDRPTREPHEVLHESARDCPHFQPRKPE